jgi:hypothetical protein
MKMFEKNQDYGRIISSSANDLAKKVLENLKNLELDDNKDDYKKLNKLKNKILEKIMVQKHSQDEKIGSKDDALVTKRINNYDLEDILISKLHHYTANKEIRSNSVGSLNKFSKNISKSIKLDKKQQLDQFGALLKIEDYQKGIISIGEGNFDSKIAIFYSSQKIDNFENILKDKQTFLDFLGKWFIAGYLMDKSFKLGDYMNIFLAFLIIFDKNSLYKYLQIFDYFLRDKNKYKELLKYKSEFEQREAAISILLGGK